MITLCFCLDASIPPSTPRQLITRSRSGLSPPSRVSSQLDNMAPFAFDEFLHASPPPPPPPSRPYALLSPLMPSALMIRAWHFGQLLQRTFGHSSPPTWIYSGREKIDHLAEHVFRGHCLFIAGTDHIVRYAPLWVHTSYGPPEQPRIRLPTGGRSYFWDDRDETFLSVSDHVVGFRLAYRTCLRYTVCRHICRSYGR